MFPTITNSQAHLDMDTEKCIFLIAVAVECSNFLLTPLDTDASTATMLAHPSCKYCETILRNIFEIIFTFAIRMGIIGKCLNMRVIGEKSLETGEFGWKHHSDPDNSKLKVPS